MACRDWTVEMAYQVNQVSMVSLEETDLMVYLVSTAYLAYLVKEELQADMAAMARRVILGQEDPKDRKGTEDYQVQEVEEAELEMMERLVNLGSIYGHWAILRQ